MNYFKRIVMLLLLGSCTQKNSDKSFEIKGKIDGLGNGKVYVLSPAQTSAITDTLATGNVTDDTFKLKGKVEFPRLAKISFSGTKKKPRPVPIVLENTVIYFRGDFLGTYKLDFFGGKWNEKVINQFNYNPKYSKDAAIARGLYVDFNTLQDIWEKDSTKIDQKIIRKKATDYFSYSSRAGKRKIKLIQEEFKQTNEPLFKAMLVLNYWPKVKITDEEVVAITKTLGDANYYSKLLNQKITERNKTIEAQKATTRGKIAKNFVVLDRNDDKVSSADIISKNKYTLLEFWASWCGPCRAEIPNLKKSYEDFNTKGYEILGVSVDKNRDQWITASEKEAFPYIDTWASKETNDVQKLFGIKAIPFNLLVDRKGMIVAKNLREEALHDKLKELFTN